MPLYITVRERATADTAETLLLTGDERVGIAVFEALAESVAETAPARMMPRSSVPRKPSAARHGGSQLPPEEMSNG